MKKYLPLLLGFSLLASVQVSYAANLEITSNYFEYGSVRYFRGKAESVRIGSYGEKKNPFGSNTYLAVQNAVRWEHLIGRVRFVTAIDISWDKTTKAEVEAGGMLRVFGLGFKTASGLSYEHAKSGRLKLAKFAIGEGPLQNMLNREADGARNYLANQGYDGRIVSEVWVIMDAELAEHFSTSSSLSLTVSAGGSALEVTARSSRYGSQTITLSEGTTFAYLLHKVTDWNRGKTQVQDMEDDQVGIG